MDTFCLRVALSSNIHCRLFIDGNEVSFVPGQSYSYYTAVSSPFTLPIKILEAFDISKEEVFNG